MHQKLDHLQPADVRELLVRYYEEEEKIADIIEDFDLDIKPGVFVSILPPFVHEDKFCKYCSSEHLVSKRLSRSHGKWAIGKLQCPSCNHEETGYCRCKNCEQAKLRQQEAITDKKKQIIKDLYLVPYTEQPDEDDIDLIEAVALLSLIPHSLSEDYFSVEPFREAPIPFAPTFEFQKSLTEGLFADGCISIGSTSDESAFVFDDELTTITGYYPMRVIWEFLPSLLSVQEKTDYIDKIRHMADGPNWPDSWRDSLLQTWRLIAKYECLENYRFLLAKRDYEPEKFGDKTHQVFDDMLKVFSVAQIFNLTWQAVRDTTDYIVSENLPRYHAKNSFIGQVQRKSERAQANNWDVKNSRRDFDCPQSSVSSTFANVFLGLGDEAFVTIPFDAKKMI